MPDINEVYAGVERLARDELLLRRQNIVNKVTEIHGGNYRALGDDDLTELMAVNVALRKKNAGPPSRVKAGPKEAASLDDLA